jgi:transposase
VTGEVVVRRSMRRQKLVDFVAQFPSCIVAMEACCGAHHIGRLLAAQGHEVRLMSPDVRPYVKLWQGEHNFTNHEAPIMQRNAT